jgi:hypothetical protein
MANPIVDKKATARKSLYVHGFGINDAEYVVSPRINGKQVRCPFYTAWKSMIVRCHNPKYQQTRPTYIGCQVCEEWRYFSTFRKWMTQQNWQEQELDKDFLGDGKLYSPETCIFIPGWLNILFCEHSRKISGLPPGVWMDHGRFRSSLYVNGKVKRVGSFSTVEEAHAAYTQAKTDYVVSLYPAIAEIDARLVSACERRLQQLKDKIYPHKRKPVYSNVETAP